MMDNIRIPRPTPDVDLVTEAILREMASATRWYTIQIAWDALLTVRRIHDGIMEETKLREESYGTTCGEEA
jgi:hypothetical protein